ncbi:MAG: cupin domain-containing protein [Candidatus Puniceispirillaceae bacterium]
MTVSDSPIQTAEIIVPSSDLRDDLPFFTKTLGFRLEQIFPADDPAVAVLSGHGVRLRLDSRCPDETPCPRLCLQVDDPAAFANGEQIITAPNGVVIEIAQRNPPLLMPPTQHRYVVRRLVDQAPWVIGRAGMHYRDLIPDRLGGSIIASHIRIPDGGPVPDMVHYHTVGFQLIFCIAGWVDLVYEDQGPEFRLHAGDCVIQPPEIRHRVLFASDNIEVIEIGVPAEHVTTIDHEMTLPNGPTNPDRLFHGQRFIHHKQAEADWHPWRIPGFVHRDTGILDATNGVANVQVARWQGGETRRASHDCDILFHFVMTGTMRLEVDGQEPSALSAGDAFVVPPGAAAAFCDCSDDLELMEVALPGAFTTDLHDPA